LKYIILLALSLLLGCSSTAKIELLGNESVGDHYYSEITPQGIVREVWSDYSIYLPIPGMHGKFKFKFEAIAEGEAEIVIYNNFRRKETRYVTAYKAVVDKNKKLTLTEKEPEPAEPLPEEPPNPHTCEISNYKTANINGQTWLAENWNCNVPKSKCYNDNPDNCSKYGRLYTWEMAKTTCPSGWHLPSDDEWNALMKTINPNCQGNSTCAATALKDTSGFAALLGGRYNWIYVSSNPPKAGGRFQDIGNKGYWWSSGTPNLRTDAYWHITSDSEYAYYTYTDPGQLSIVGVGNTPFYSVRCVKTEPQQTEENQ